VASLASPEEQGIRRIDGGKPVAALGSAAWSGGAGDGGAGARGGEMQKQARGRLGRAAK
jgi:hypothetical protein